MFPVKRGICAGRAESRRRFSPQFYKQRAARISGTPAPRTQGRRFPPGGVSEAHDSAACVQAQRNSRICASPPASNPRTQGRRFPSGGVSEAHDSAACVQAQRNSRIRASPPASNPRTQGRCFPPEGVSEAHDSAACVQAQRKTQGAAHLLQPRTRGHRAGVFQLGE